MKYYLKVFWFYAKWVFLFLLQGDDRLRYQFGKIRGMKVEKTSKDMFGMTLHLNPNRKPEREYTIFRDFKKYYYPNNRQ